MSTFLAGILFGFLLAGSVAVIFITSKRKPKPHREPIEWVPEFHEPQPLVTTRILVNRRSIEL
jgi:hypothetical protein